jgi:hypothetical protein
MFYHFLCKTVHVEAHLKFEKSSVAGGSRTVDMAVLKTMCGGREYGREGCGFGRGGRGLLALDCQ